MCVWVWVCVCVRACVRVTDRLVSITCTCIYNDVIIIVQAST